nr:hypothetical protein BaRGS_021206 [Batillaria attramentaria]
MELCDFKVKAEGRVFEVHKALLAATSDYFRVMFGGVMAESKQDIVDLKGVTADGLQHIIDFIYSYIKSLMTFDNAEDFLHIADTYSLDKVTAHWESMIQDKFFEFSQVTLLKHSLKLC